MSTPAHTPYVVVGAGMHGLSTAWHLARELEARGAGSGADIVVLDMRHDQEQLFPARHARAHGP